MIRFTSTATPHLATSPGGRARPLPSNTFGPSTTRIRTAVFRRKSCPKDGPDLGFLLPIWMATGTLDSGEWDYYRAAAASQNGLLAIRAGGRGDMTESGVLWHYRKAVPQLPSPLLFKGVLYMINDGGIVTTFNPGTGEVIAQGRLKGAVDNYYASPVAGDDKVYMVSELGKVAVLGSDGSLEVQAVNDLDDLCYATPAIVSNRIYLRTPKRALLFWAIAQEPAHPIPLAGLVLQNLANKLFGQARRMSCETDNPVAIDHDRSRDSPYTIELGYVTLRVSLIE